MGNLTHINRHWIALILTACFLICLLGCSQRISFSEEEKYMRKNFSDFVTCLEACERVRAKCDAKCIMFQLTKGKDALHILSWQQDSTWESCVQKDISDADIQGFLLRHPISDKMVLTSAEGFFSMEYNMTGSLSTKTTIKHYICWVEDNAIETILQNLDWTHKPHLPENESDIIKYDEIYSLNYLDDEDRTVSLYLKPYTENMWFYAVEYSFITL